MILHRKQKIPNTRCTQKSEISLLFCNKNNDYTVHKKHYATQCRAAWCFIFL